MKPHTFILFALISVLAVSVNAHPSFDLATDSMEKEWTEFKNKYNKSYQNEAEHNLRKKNYFENRYRIMKHNLEFEKSLNSQDGPTFKLALNKYADMSHLEFVSTMNGFKKSLKKTNGSLYLPTHNVAIPEELDWRKEGYVTEVKDQGRCGSCWAFSATGSLEGQTYRKMKKQVSLSEQNLVDCSGEYGNLGCDGGSMEASFQYIKDNHGIDTEKSYPYEGINGKCRYNPKNKGSEDTGYVQIPQGDEDALLEAVATVGPVSVAIDASLTSFSFYGGGVYDVLSCSTQELDHGVLVVGYGVDKQSGKKYWLVKNSWGESWGEKGYVKMARGKNLCGIATDASYPLV